MCLVWEVRLVHLAVQYSLFDVFWFAAVSVGVENLPLGSLLLEEVQHGILDLTL